MKQTNEKQATRKHIEPAMMKAKQFLKEKFQREGTIIQVAKEEQGWLVEIEVVEPNVYMEKLGVPNPVMERYGYVIGLDEQLQPISFRRRYLPLIS